MFLVSVLEVMICRDEARLTFRIVVAGMQWESKSYNLALTWRMRAGVRSSMISLAMTSIRASQSGGGIGVFSETLSLDGVLASEQG